MELLKQYWWVVLGVVVIVVLISKRSAAPQGATVQQIGPNDNGQLTQIAVAERQADEQNRIGLIGALLGYLQGQDNLAATERINTANLAANVQIAQATGQANTASANAAYNAQLQAAQLAAANQAAAIAAQNAANSRNAWSGVLTGGLGVLGGLLGNFGSSSGGYGTPGFNPNIGGGWGWGF